MDRMQFIINKINKSRDSKIKSLFWKIVWKRYQIKYLLSIPSSTKIGENFKILHYGNIVINNGTTIGDNVTVANGVTLGLIFRGRRKGCPKIGNNVFIGANSTVVGNVKIGNNVVINPNTFVNFDVPDNSLVLGNPGVIHKRRDLDK